ncbi:hypothetical protein ACIXQ7_21575 [Bacteroides fragilis]
MLSDCNFIEMNAFCIDRQHHKLIQGFDWEQELKRMPEYLYLVDDECISCMKVV